MYHRNLLLLFVALFFLPFPIIANKKSFNVKATPRGILEVVAVDSLNYTVKLPGQVAYSFTPEQNWQVANSRMLQMRGSIAKPRSLYLKYADGQIKRITISVSPQHVYSIWFWISLVLFLVSFGWVLVRFFKYRFSVERLDLEMRLQKTTERLISQRQNYEQKLAESLPKEEAEALKANVKAKRYKMVTVLFSDVMGFSKLTLKDNPDKLVDDLDKFFFKFDQTVKKYNIQKIKSIGDSYMCAGGIPKKNRTNPLEVVLAALEMQNYIEELKSKYPDRENRIWGLRIGIHTGPVFAGKEGRKKQAYDIWGETVNIASRMESSGQIGRINISGNTYELIRDYFLCNYQGKMPVKFQGDTDMYFIEGFRPTLSKQNMGFHPNDDFYTKLAFIRFDDLEEEILDLLEKRLPTNMHYHNLKHTIDVVTQVELIGRKEDVTDNEMLLLKTAALFHDVGFIHGYKDHELLGIKMAKEILPRYNYSEGQIEQVSDIVFSTKLPPNPSNKLEAIICDADLDYLGRADFIPVSQMLFKEFVEHGVIPDDYYKWNQIQIKFIDSHQYFTETAKSLRDVNKKKQLSNIRNQIKVQN
ncbi:MAG: HD domain-containing protein [Salinivirgaceae bacterium]|jgi:adenylate cyclase|nr:HD domain-containing protein [Salinivirgaceae bacterium]